jgi:signal transduction histidine kinase
MLKGKGWGEIFFDREENDNFNQLIIDVIIEKKVNYHKKVSYLRPNGDILHLSITTSYLRESNEVVGVVVLIDDVTELHQLHEREKTILEEKNLVMKERVQSMKKLAVGVAHQVRNPITSIGGFAIRMLKKMEKDDEYALYLNNILTGTKRLEKIVKAVNVLTESLTLEKEKVFIPDIMEEARQRLTQKAINLCKKIHWDTAYEPAEAIIDRDKFGEALDEILMNSLESLKDEDGSINIVLSQTGHEIRVEISDSGGGISDHDKPYIFDPFFSTKAVGIGMGLCKAQKIIKTHKGELTIGSNLGKGTKATIAIPN